MTNHRKILLLNVPKFRRTRRRFGRQTSKIIHFRGLYLAFVVKLLRFFGYRFTTVSEATRSSENKLACLTFDGADRDLHRNVHPLLNRLKVPATAFVATDIVGQKWKTVGRDTRAQLLGQSPQMTWKNIRTLARSGWEIGCLSATPDHLTAQGYAGQRDSIQRSRDMIALRTGQAPATFAYPYGAYDTTTVSCVREAGFANAVTLRPGVNSSDLLQGSGKYHLCRITLSGRRLKDAWALLRFTLRKPVQADSGDGLASSRRADAGVAI